MKLTSIRWIGPILLTALWATSASATVSVEEVIRLHTAGLSQQSLLLVISNSDTPDTILTSDLNALLDADVPDTVITLMVASASSVLEDWEAVDLDAELDDREYFEEDDDDVYSTFTLVIGGGWGDYYDYNDYYGWGWNNHYGYWPYYDYWTAPLYAGWWFGGWWGTHYNHYYGHHHYAHHYAHHWNNYGYHHGYGYYPGYYGCQIPYNGYYADTRYHWGNGTNYGNTRYRNAVEGNRYKGGTQTRYREDTYPGTAHNGSTWDNPRTKTDVMGGTYTRNGGGKTVKDDVKDATRSRDQITKMTSVNKKNSGRDVLSKGKTPTMRSDLKDTKPQIKTTTNTRTTKGADISTKGKTTVVSKDGRKTQTKATKDKRITNTRKITSSNKRTTTNSRSTQVGSNSAKRTTRSVARTTETRQQKLDRYKSIKGAQRSSSAKSGRVATSTPRATAKAKRSARSNRPAHSVGTATKSSKSGTSARRPRHAPKASSGKSTARQPKSAPAKVEKSTKSAPPPSSTPSARSPRKSSGGRSATTRSSGSKGSSSTRGSSRSGGSSGKKGDRL